MRSKNLTTLLIILILGNLIACGSKTIKTESDPTITKYAKELERIGDFNKAAEEYLALAKAHPSKRIDYKLVATEMFIKEQSIASAQKTLDTIRKKLNTNQHILKNIYTAQILLAQNQLESAQTLLNVSISATTPKQILAKLHQTRASLLHQQEKYFIAATERIHLSTYLENDWEINNNYNDLWTDISYLSPEQIRSYLQQEPTALKSWLELALVRHNILRDKKNLNLSIVMWQQRYPDHPALTTIVPSIINHAKTIETEIEQIAMLLPFGDNYRHLSIAIREGFISSWYADQGTKPSITIYQTDLDNITEIYTQAIAEGADYIVGPLRKAMVARLIEESDSNNITKTLLLNQYIGSKDIFPSTNIATLPLFMQFYISPEEEAQQIAEQGWFSGHSRVLIISAENNIDRRITDAFSKHWQLLGGKILAQTTIRKAIKSLKAPVEMLLNIDQSKRRNTQLRSLLKRNLQHAVRHRQDADIIFMAVPPIIARRLIPELHRYDPKQKVNVYATSNIYTGNPDKRQDIDIEGVIFSDMPWLLDKEAFTSPLSREFAKLQPAHYKKYKRLYAFGIDAYGIIPHTTSLILQADQAYFGKTGELKFTPQGKMRRKLSLGRFVNGEIEPYGNTIGDLN